DGEAAQEVERGYDRAGDGQRGQCVGDPQQVQRQAGQGGQDHRRGHKRTADSAQALTAVAFQQQQRQKDKPDKNLVPQVHDGNCANLLQAVAAAKQTDTQQAIFKPGGEKWKIVVGNLQLLFEQLA